MPNFIQHNCLKLLSPKTQCILSFLLYFTAYYIPILMSRDGNSSAYLELYAKYYRLVWTVTSTCSWN